MNVVCDQGLVTLGWTRQHLQRLVKYVLIALLRCLAQATPCLLFCEFSSYSSVDQVLEFLLVVLLDLPNRIPIAIPSGHELVD